MKIDFKKLKKFIKSDTKTWKPIISFLSQGNQFSVVNSISEILMSCITVLTANQLLTGLISQKI